MIATAASPAEAFDAVAAGYADDVGANPVLGWMRSRAREALTAHVAEGGTILELGCGPGIDAVWLAQRGYRVTALDVSSRMVAEAHRRVASAGVGSRVTIQCLAIEDVRALSPSRFSAVYASLGPLNCVDLTPLVARQIAECLEVGGALVTTVMGRWCPLEWLRFGLVGQIGRARARARIDGVRVGRTAVRTRYYRPAELATIFEAVGLRTEYWSGLGIVVPPPYLKGWAARHPRMLRRLVAIDDHIGTLPLASSCGDHFLLVMRRSGERA